MTQQTVDEAVDDLSVWQAVRRGPIRHWLIPVLLVLVPAMLWFVAKDTYWRINDEDQLAEWGTCFVYLLASGLAVTVVLRLHRAGLRLEALMWTGLALAFLYVAGEEISWGQRLFGFDGPTALVAANQQSEANTHNLVGARSLSAAFIVVGLMGAFGARWLVRRIPRLRDRPWLFAPPARLAPWFLVVSVYYAFFGFIDKITNPLLGWSYTVQQIERLQEVVELSMSIGMALFVWSVSSRIRAGGLDEPNPRGPIGHDLAAGSGRIES